MSPRPIERLARFAPGLPALLRYRFAADFRHDLVAGISVAAVALPVAVAYAELAGFDPVVGLYSCILPLVAYAFFGTSRQLMVNPDAATCAMIAAAITPLAAGDPALYGSLAILLTFFTGLFCIAASFLRLGALADFLSKPRVWCWYSPRSRCSISARCGTSGRSTGARWRCRCSPCWAWWRWARSMLF